MLSKYFLKYPVLISLFVATSSFAIVKFGDNEQVVVAYDEPIVEVMDNHPYFLYPMDVSPIELLPQQVNIEPPEPRLPQTIDEVIRPIKYTSRDYPYDLSLLTEALFHEARGDDYVKVFAVIMNRVHHRIFGNTVHSVIHQPSHFSYLTDLTDSELRARERREKEKYDEIRRWVHQQFVRGSYVDGTGGSLYYYAHNKMDEPFWWGNQYATVETDGHRFATWHLVK